jgi:hypothetical protein
VRAGPLGDAANGYHFARGAQILDWLGPYLYAAEIGAEETTCGDCGGVVAREARLVRGFRSWGLAAELTFAAGCVMAAFERNGPAERGSLAALAGVMAYALGRAPAADLALAGYAARGAAWAAFGKYGDSPRTHAALAVDALTRLEVIAALRLAASCDRRAADAQPLPDPVILHAAPGPLTDALAARGEDTTIPLGPLWVSRTARGDQYGRLLRVLGEGVSDNGR